MTDAVEVEKCKHCGSERYVVNEIYTNYRRRVMLVECYECKHDAIPVVLDHFEPADEGYDRCRKAWNAANG